MKPIVPVVVVIALVAGAAVFLLAADGLGQTEKGLPIVSTRAYKVCDVAGHAKHTTQGVDYYTPHLLIGDNIEIGTVNTLVDTYTDVTFPGRTLAMRQIGNNTLTADIEYEHTPTAGGVKSAIKHHVELVSLGYIGRPMNACRGGNRIRFRFCVLEKDAITCPPPSEYATLMHLGDVHAEN